MILREDLVDVFTEEVLSFVDKFEIGLDKNGFLVLNGEFSELEEEYIYDNPTVQHLKLLRNGINQFLEYLNLCGNEEILAHEDPRLGYKFSLLSQFLRDGGLLPPRENPFVSGQNANQLINILSRKYPFDMRTIHMTSALLMVKTLQNKERSEETMGLSKWVLSLMSSLLIIYDSRDILTELRDWAFWHLHGNIGGEYQIALDYWHQNVESSESDFDLEFFRQAFEVELNRLIKEEIEKARRIYREISDLRRDFEFSVSEIERLYIKDNIERLTVSMNQVFLNLPTDLRVKVFARKKALLTYKCKGLEYEMLGKEKAPSDGYAFTCVLDNYIPNERVRVGEELEAIFKYLFRKGNEYIFADWVVDGLEVEENTYKKARPGNVDYTVVDTRLNIIGLLNQCELRITTGVDYERCRFSHPLFKLSMTAESRVGLYPDAVSLAALIARRKAAEELYELYTKGLITAQAFIGRGQTSRSLRLLTNGRFNDVEDFILLVKGNLEKSGCSIDTHSLVLGSSGYEAVWIDSRDNNFILKAGRSIFPLHRINSADIYTFSPNGILVQECRFDSSGRLIPLGSYDFQHPGSIVNCRFYIYENSKRIPILSVNEIANIIAGDLPLEVENERGEKVDSENTKNIKRFIFCTTKELKALRENLKLYNTEKYVTRDKSMQAEILNFIRQRVALMTSLAFIKEDFREVPDSTEFKTQVFLAFRNIVYPSKYKDEEIFALFWERLRDSSPNLLAFERYLNEYLPVSFMKSVEAKENLIRNKYLLIVIAINAIKLMSRFPSRQKINKLYVQRILEHTFGIQGSKFNNIDDFWQYCCSFLFCREEIERYKNAFSRKLKDEHNSLDTLVINLWEGLLINNEKSVLYNRTQIKKLIHVCQVENHLDRSDVIDIKSNIGLIE